MQQFRNSFAAQANDHFETDEERELFHGVADHELANGDGGGGSVYDEGEGQ